MVNVELKNAANQVLTQLSAVLGQLNNLEYCQPIKLLNNSSIGQHVRHTLEFFTCLLDGYVSGTVNYDKRNHDLSLESDRTQALAMINSISTFINKLQKEHQFKLELDYGIDCDQTCQINSNINRELAYNIEHAIHHMAIIKIGIQSICKHISIPSNFGVANSTVRYKKIQQNIER